MTTLFSRHLTPARRDERVREVRPQDRPRRTPRAPCRSVCPSQTPGQVRPPRHRHCRGIFDAVEWRSAEALRRLRRS